MRKKERIDFFFSCSLWVVEIRVLSDSLVEKQNRRVEGFQDSDFL